jgi:hypothetical protein
LFVSKQQLTPTEPFLQTKSGCFVLFQAVDRLLQVPRVTDLQNSPQN